MMPSGYLDSLLITLDTFAHLDILIEILIWNTGVLSVLLNTGMMSENHSKVKTL